MQTTVVECENKNNKRENGCDISCLKEYVLLEAI